MRILYQRISATASNKVASGFDKVYTEERGDGSALRELLGYVRAGDTVTVWDARDLGDGISGFVEAALALYRMQVVLVCQTPAIDTAAGYWQDTLSDLDQLTNKSKGTEGERPSRFIEDLHGCFEQVRLRKMTVEEACEKMRIGKATYYRYWRKVMTAPQKERHKELFEELMKRVDAKEISVQNACEQMNIGVGTYYRMKKQYEKENA